MNIHELMPKFPPSCYIKEQILLVNPNEFHRLEGIDIDSSRVAGAARPWRSTSPSS